MEIRGVVHCFFEQSGTFKNEFKKLGYEAYDYDIQNNFGETDCVIDLFNEIDKAYDGKSSVFDSISKNDIIVAFYPCVYFCAPSQMLFSISHKNYKKLKDEDKIKQILKRSDKRKDFYDRLIKFCCVCIKNNIRMILENSWSEQTYLKGNFIKNPDVVDMDRTVRGDYFKKPTAYWFWNCEPTHGESYQYKKVKKTITYCRQNKIAGMCSEERSMISSDYARNFICDFILGKQQDFGQLKLL